MTQLDRKSFFHVALLCIGILGSLCTTRAQADDKTPVLLALGDSITAGFNAKRFGDNRQYSWSTGLSLEESIINELSTYYQKKFYGINLATVGATSDTVLGQVGRLSSIKADFATVLVGANDLCRHLNDFDSYAEVYRENFTQILKTLISTNSDMKIFISKVPNLGNLYQTTKDIKSCRKKWEVLPVCRTYLRNSTEENRTRFDRNWEKLIKIQSEVAGAFNPKNVIFLDVDPGNFTVSDVSTHDCFHPSIKGQSLLGSRSWTKIIESGAL